MQQLIQTVTDVTYKLADIAQEEGYDVKEITKIWATLPTSDTDEMTYLEAAGQAALEVSSLVDEKYIQLPRSQRLAKKYRLMSYLLAAKAELLRGLYN